MDLSQEDNAGKVIVRSIEELESLLEKSEEEKAKERSDFERQIKEVKDKMAAQEILLENKKVAEDELKKELSICDASKQEVEAYVNDQLWKVIIEYQSGCEAGRTLILNVLKQKLEEQLGLMEQQKIVEHELNMKVKDREIRLVKAEKDLKDTNDKHMREIEKKMGEMEDKLLEAQANYKAELDKKDTNYATQVAEIKNNHNAQLNGNAQKHATQVAAIKDNHNAQLNGNAKQHAHEVQQLNARVQAMESRLKDSMDNHQREVVELKALVNDLCEKVELLVQELEG